MANNLIQIKRSATNPTVPTLANGELAFTQATNILYIGGPDGNGNIPIGSKLNPGVLTANQVLVANNTSGIDKVIVANLVATKIWANGAGGTSGQILASNTDGSIYWMSVGEVGTNVDSQYTWSNTQTFSNTITFSSTINGTANNALYLGGTVAASYQLNSTLAANVATLTANNAAYLGGTIASSYATQSYVTSQGYITSSALSGYQTTAGLAGNVATLAANSATYLGGNTASDFNTYADNKAANAYSNAMSDTLSRNGTYTGNNQFSANVIFSGANTTVTGYLTTANAQLASLKLRNTQLIGGSYDRNIVDVGGGEYLTLTGGSYGVNIRAANDGTSFFSLFLNGNDGSFTPSANGTMDLGSAEKRFGKLYLAGSTIVLGNTSLSSTGDALTVNNLVVSTNATINTIIGTLTTISSNVTITGANVNMTTSQLNVRDATVSGNLTINGTLTTIDTNTLQVKDSNIAIATNNTISDTIDFGFYGAYKNGGTQYYSGLFRDHGISTATNPYFHLFTTTTEPTAIVDTTAAGYRTGTLSAYLESGAFVANSTVVNITANSTVSSAIVANSITLTTALAAIYGGTGQTSYTAGDLLYASSGTALSKLSVPGSVANGQVLQIVNNLPAYGTLDAGTF